MDTQSLRGMLRDAEAAEQRTAAGAVVDELSRARIVAAGRRSARARVVLVAASAVLLVTASAAGWAALRWGADEPELAAPGPTVSASPAPTPSGTPSATPSPTSSASPSTSPSVEDPAGPTAPGEVTPGVGLPGAQPLPAGALAQAGEGWSLVLQTDYEQPMAVHLLYLVSPAGDVYQVLDLGQRVAGPSLVHWRAGDEFALLGTEQGVQRVHLTTGDLSPARVEFTIDGRVESVDSPYYLGRSSEGLEIWEAGEVDDPYGRYTIYAERSPRVGLAPVPAVFSTEITNGTEVLRDGSSGEYPLYAYLRATQQDRYEVVLTGSGQQVAMETLIPGFPRPSECAAAWGAAWGQLELYDCPEAAEWGTPADDPDSYRIGWFTTDWLAEQGYDTPRDVSPWVLREADRAALLVDQTVTDVVREG